MKVPFKFLGNLGYDQFEDRKLPAYCRLADEADEAVKPGDKFVVVFKGEVEIEVEKYGITNAGAAVAEDVWSMMNMDDRPTGQFFRSMCIGDVVVIGETAYAALMMGFAMMDGCPDALDGLDEAGILKAYKDSIDEVR